MIPISMLPIVLVTRLALRLALLPLAFSVVGRALPAQIPVAARARLDSLQHAPEIAGAAIYRGSVFRLRGDRSDTLYTYERRVQRDSTTLRVSHSTRSREYGVIIEESAGCSADYALQRFDATNAQSGFVGSAVVSADGRRVDFRLERGGHVTTASQRVRDPVVSGPTVHGFVRAHWDSLLAGARINVRMIVMTRLTTYGFEVRADPASDGNTTFTMTPSSAIVRLVVAPLRVTFDSARNVVSYEGRVPPMRVQNGRLHDLDARVNYSMLAPVYR